MITRITRIAPNAVARCMMGNASTAKIEALCVDVQGQDLLEVVYEALSSLYFENITINDKFAVAAGQLTELEQY